MDILAAVACEQADLDDDQGANVPGQPWTCYRSWAHDEKLGEKDLKARLRDLLTPSTTQEELDRIPKRDNTTYCPYLRLKQKSMDRSGWLVDDDVDKGAHFPLCVFTENAWISRNEGGVQGARSEG